MRVADRQQVALVRRLASAGGSTGPETSSTRTVASPRGVAAKAANHVRWPNRPVGRQTSTARHDDVDQHLGRWAGAALEAAEVLRNVFSRFGQEGRGRRCRSALPTMGGHERAPLIEPMPPMTMTTKATIRMSSPHADLSPSLRGAAHQAGEACEGRRPSPEQPG